MSSILVTLRLELPPSNSDSSHAPTISLASSTPTTREPSAKICALLLFACPLRRIGVVRLRRPHTRDFVGRNRHPDTGAADQDTAVTSPLGDGFGEAVRHVGVIVFGAGAIVFDAHAAPLEVTLKLIF